MTPSNGLPVSGGHDDARAAVDWDALLRENMRLRLKVRLAASIVGRWYFAGCCRCGRLIRWRGPEVCPRCFRWTS